MNSQIIMWYLLKNKARWVDGILTDMDDHIKEIISTKIIDLKLEGNLFKIIGEKFDFHIHILTLVISKLDDITYELSSEYGQRARIVAIK